MIRKILNNDYSLSMINKVFVIVVGFISSVYSTRYLGLEYKGIYSYISQTANLFVLFFNFGVYQSYSYYYRIYGKKIFNKYINICFFQFIVYLLFSILLAIISHDFTTVLIIILIPFNILKLQFENIMLVENFRRKVIVNMFNYFIQMLSFIILYYTANPSVLIIIVLTIIIDLFTSFFYTVRSKYRPSIKEIDFSFLIKTVKFGFLPMLSSLLVTLNYNVDIIFLKELSSTEHLSLYSLAANLMTYIWMIPDAFKDVLFSKVARSNDNSAVSFSIKISLLVILMGMIGFIILGKPFLIIFYGEEFLDSYVIVILLFIGAISMVFFKMFGIVFIAEGKRYAHFVILFISVIINIIANVLLVPRLGMYGAAFASAASYNICGLSFLIYYSKVKKVTIKDLIFITKKDVKGLILILRKKV